MAAGARSNFARNLKENSFVIIGKVRNRDLAMSETLLTALQLAIVVVIACIVVAIALKTKG
jgi:hypothetical protein